jgi:hypothetical protein
MASRGSLLPVRIRWPHGSRRRRARPAPLVLLLVLLSSLRPSPGAAQMGLPSSSPNQPEAIEIRGLTPPPCPLIVPASSLDTQPLRISPSQVALKNRMGCLSEADAIYGPDGCPLRFCSKQRNPIQLPRF